MRWRDTHEICEIESKQWNQDNERKDSEILMCTPNSFLWVCLCNQNITNKCNSYLIHTDINQVIKAALNEGRSEPYSTKMKWPLLRLSHISALLVHDCSQVLKESRRWWIVHCRSHSPISHTVIYFTASIGSIYNCQPLWAMASFFLLSSAFSYLFFSTYAFYSSFCEFRFLFYLFKTSLK